VIRHKLIQQIVETLLDEANVSAAPVDATAIAESKGAIVVQEKNEDDFSGFLYRSTDSAPIIGVNSKHPGTRRRFTIAHELAHLLLHPRSGVHVDEGVFQMRDARASTGSDEEEVEANRFAAELLMPRRLLEADIEALGKIYLDDEKTVANLAKKYCVSSQSMTIRLSTLGLVRM